jgi:methylenetetrahydrofolate reductase (NADPH)
MSQDRACSLEFFPPKTDAGREKLINETLPALSGLNPEYVSVTYGAGGSTRNTTVGTVNQLQAAGQEVAPHLSFGSDDEETMLALLEAYQAQGINRLVALRGDMPSGMGGPGQLVHANKLVEFIRRHTGEHFKIAVAAYPEIHPQAKSYDWDIHYLKQKLDAGANAAVTQFFFNVESYFYFLDRCQAAGIDHPIHPGIMPILNFSNLDRFAAACGAEIPRWIRQRVAGFGDDQESIRKFGVEVVTQLCATLIESGAPPIHFYTMNQVEPVLSIANNLGLNLPTS